jgi:REP element-mobilizing transposase RayT
MATRYRFGDSQYPHFITFAVINWIDALSRPAYKEIIIDSLKHCQQEKGLVLNAWIIMSNHVHLIARCQPDFQLADVMRDLKKFTSKKIEEAIRQNSFESRKDWMLWMFKRAGEKNSNNKYFQFWQQDNHPVELYGYETLKQKLNYLHENPVRAGIVYEPWHYKFSSAIDYCSTEKGKIKLELV